MRLRETIGQIIQGDLNLNSICINMIYKFGSVMIYIADCT